MRHRWSADRCDHPSTVVASIDDDVSAVTPAARPWAGALFAGAGRITAWEDAVPHPDLPPTFLTVSFRMRPALLVRIPVLQWVPQPPALVVASLSPAPAHASRCARTNDPESEQGRAASIEMTEGARDGVDRERTQQRSLSTALHAAMRATTPGAHRRAARRCDGQYERAALCDGAAVVHAPARTWQVRWRFAVAAVTARDAVDRPVAAGPPSGRWTVAHARAGSMRTVSAGPSGRNRTLTEGRMRRVREPHSSLSASEGRP